MRDLCVRSNKAILDFHPVLTRPQPASCYNFFYNSRKSASKITKFLKTLLKWADIAFLGHHKNSKTGYFTCQTGGASKGVSQHQTLTLQCPCFKLAQCWTLIITGFLKMSPLGPQRTIGLSCVCFSDNFGRCRSSLSTAINTSSFWPRVSDPSGTFNATPAPGTTNLQPDEVAIVDAQQPWSNPEGIALLILYNEFLEVAKKIKKQILVLREYHGP